MNKAQRSIEGGSGSSVRQDVTIKWAAEKTVHAATVLARLGRD